MNVTFHALTAIQDAGVDSQPFLTILSYMVNYHERLGRTFSAQQERDQDGPNQEQPEAELHHHQ